MESLTKVRDDDCERREMIAQYSLTKEAVSKAQNERLQVRVAERRKLLAGCVMYGRERKMWRVEVLWTKVDGCELGYFAR